MLHEINRKYNYVPGKFINKLTMGEEGSTLCARLYLHKYCFKKKNLFKVFLCTIIDLLEKDHCKIAARTWKIEYKRKNLFVRSKYKQISRKYVGRLPELDIGAVLKTVGG